MVARFVFVLVALVAAACGSDSRGPTQPSPDPGQALRLTCPAAATASTTGTSMPVTFATPSATGGRAPVTVSCAPASGTIFPLGSTTVACTATDARAATAACSFAVTVTRVPTLSRTRFLAFGDSITLGEVTVPVTSAADQARFPFGKLQIVPSASYPTQLHSLLTGTYTAQTGDIAMTNAGRSGEAAIEGVVRFPGVMSTVRPDVVLIVEGYNDLNTYGTSFISRAVSAIETMAKEGRGRGARVLIGSLTPPRPGGRNSITTFDVTEFNIRLRNMTLGEGAVYVDLYTPLLGNVTTYIGTDGLHPTEAGYRRIAEEFFTAIRATLESR